MNPTAPDTRSPERRTRDEQIASEPLISPPDIAPGSTSAPIESHLRSLRQPLAVAGVVENGLVRPLDPAIRLPERSRVIIVATEG